MGAVFGAFHLTGEQAYDAAVEGPGWIALPRLEVGCGRAPRVGRPLTEDDFR